MTIIDLRETPEWRHLDDLNQNLPTWARIIPPMPLYDPANETEPGAAKRDAEIGLAHLRMGIELEPSIGIWHDSLDNPFNLADDLIEPWRPLADLHVARHLEQREAAEEGLSVADRRELARLLVAELRLDGQVTTVAWALERSVDSFLEAIRQRKADLLLLPEQV